MDPVLAPIDHPSGLLMRMAYAMSRLRFGKVLSALKVIYARKPALALLAQKIVSTQARLSLDAEIKALVQVQAARLNGCRFCEDILLAQAYRRSIGLDRFAQLADHRTSPLFTDREKAALALAEEATTRRKVGEATWRLVRQHFTDEQIVELVWLNASENYFNLQAAVLELGSDGISSAQPAT